MIVSSPVLPASPANMSMFDVISVPQSTLQSDEVSQQTKKRNFGIANSSKSDNLPIANSTPLFVDKDAKSETLVSANKVAAQVNAPDKTVNMNTPVCGDAVFKSGDPPSVETLPNTWPLTTTASTSAIPSVFRIDSRQPSAVGSTTFSDNDQMTMEDTMAEDSPQLKAPPGGCCLAPSVPSGGFVFKTQQTPVAPQTSLFQPPGCCSGGLGFIAQQSPVVPQNSLFQPSGSSEFIAGTSPNIFSLGTSTDKSQRRIYKPKKGGARRR